MRVLARNRGLLDVKSIAQVGLLGLLKVAGHYYERINVIGRHLYGLEEYCVVPHVD